MEPLGQLRRVAVLIHNRPHDLRQKNIILAGAGLLAVQIKPAKQVLFLGRKPDEAQAIAAVTAVLAVKGGVIFPEIMKQCAGNGARLLGGCCGTDPSFIAALERALA